MKWMGKGKNYNYFDAFVEAAEYSRAAAALLHEVLHDFAPQDLPAKMEQMHKIEHTADIRRHEMMSCLVKEFITPIEREDIIQLGQSIDDVTDAIEDVLMRMYMFNIRTVRPAALEFTGVLVSCCDAMKKALEEFHNFRKSTQLQPLIIELNRLEESGDKLYTDAMRDLYLNTTNAAELMAWTDNLNRLEQCCDACEDVANVIAEVVMKNS